LKEKKTEMAIEHKQENAREEADEANSHKLLTNIEESIIYYTNKLSKDEQDSSNKKFELVDRDEFRKQLNDLYSDLVETHMGIIKKSVLSKSFTKKAITTKETCVRLLTLCVQQSFAYAKQIATEFNYFNDYKNWLERCLLTKQSDLRELCIQFLLSFLKYGKPQTTTANSAENLANIIEHTNKENLVLIKRIFLGVDSSSLNSSVGKKTKTDLSLIYCLFAHVATDTKESIEFMLQELLFKLVQNDFITKSEKVRIFNEKNLLNLIKLYEWRYVQPSYGDEVEEADKETLDETQKNELALNVRQMTNEFLKILFCSTRYGINFYDRTLNIDQSPKNFNHLIFNTILNIHRFSLINKKTYDLNAKTNEMNDDLLLKVFKICPDLIQRFLKVKYKQELNKNNSK
jgi:hypothetical protein